MSTCTYETTDCRNVLRHNKETGELRAVATCDYGSDAERIVEVLNSMTGITQPVEVIQSAREALEWTLQQAKGWRGAFTGSEALEDYDAELAKAERALSLLNPTEAQS